MHTRTCMYQGVRNHSFSEKFIYILNGKSLQMDDPFKQGRTPIFISSKSLAIQSTDLFPKHDKE